MMTAGHRHKVRLSRARGHGGHPAPHVLRSIHGTVTCKVTSTPLMGGMFLTGRRWVEKSNARFSSVHKHSGYDGKLTQASLEGSHSSASSLGLIRRQMFGIRRQMIRVRRKVPEV